jgi:hypothetical protein
MQRNSSVIRIGPRGLSDTKDGTFGFAGAMSVLQNLIPSPGDRGIVVPRPAATLIVEDFSPVTAGAAQISALLVVGHFIYGMIAAISGPYAGKDVPFCWNLTTSAFVPVSIPGGAASLPLSPSVFGDWTPPIMKQVATRVILTHPGFTGGATPFFGWIDVSGFSDTTHTGNVHGTTTIDALSANVLQAGWQNGMVIGGVDVPPNTTIKTIAADGLSLTLSNATTGGATGVALTIAGGTMAAPVWDSGNTNGFPLTAVPVSVAQFNGRAYYAVKNGVQFSDAALPCQITNATQALLFQNGLKVTALAGLPLYQSSSGILQALIAFQGDSNMYQITGDPATNNLAANGLGIGVGTNAPLTICQTPDGMAFIAPDGLRVINFIGQVNPPLGAHGEGVLVPFQSAINPTRMCAAYNQNVMRISVQNGAISSAPYQEYWYHWSEKVFSGPHTFPAAQIQPLQEPSGASSGHGFVVVQATQPAAPELWGQAIWGQALWSGASTHAGLSSSEVTPLLSSTYTENAAVLACQLKTVLLPANEELTLNNLGETAVSMALPPQLKALVTMNDQNNARLVGAVVLEGDGDPATQWGAATWDAFQWAAQVSVFRQRALPWSQPIVFTQCTLGISVSAVPGLAIGGIYMRRQKLRAPLYGAPILIPPPITGAVVTQG